MDVEKSEDFEKTKITVFEYSYLFFSMGLAVSVFLFGIYLILNSAEELPLGPALITFGSLVSGITILKSALEHDRSFTPTKMYKSVFGKETLVGVIVCFVGVFLI